MSTLAVPYSMVPRATPPWRALGALAVLVLAVHTLVLRTSPSRFSPELDPASQRTRAFVTRSIDVPPPTEVTAPPPVAAPKSVAKPVSKPALKEKEAAAEETSAQSAINSVAPQAPEPVAANGPGTSASVDSVPAQTAATAATPAPSAPAEPPAGPSQTPVTAMALPESARLEYKMTSNAKGMNWYANAELSWQNAGATYDAQMKIGAFLIGARSMASTGQVNAEGLAPTRYSEKLRSEVAAHFEPDKGQITFSANTPSAPWVKGAQDRTSVFFQLAGMLAGNPASFPVGSSISLYTVGPRDADTWTFRVEAEEKLNLPFGEIATLKVTRQPRREYDTKVEIWYAPSLNYLPVRNKITQHNGDFIDQQLSAINKS